MKQTSIQRVGLGTDIHQLHAGGTLRLAGIDISCERHLVGHSDADVVLHAITDALLGAAGLQDIGEYFPDSDQGYKGADSRELLSKVIEEVRSAGYAVVNVDVTIHAERPKLSDYKQAMRKSVATLLEIGIEASSIKAKTNEGLDAIGRGEAIACTAIVGLRRVEKQRMKLKPANKTLRRTKKTSRF